MSKSNSNTSAESIRKEMNRLRIDLSTIQRALESATADQLGELSIKAGGIQNALPILAQRLRAAELAELDEQISEQKQELLAAQRVFNAALNDLQDADRVLDVAKRQGDNVTLLTDQVIDAISQATAAKTRAELLKQRAEYGISIAIDHQQQLNNERKDLAKAPLESF
jgi:hypothetical protein